MRDEVITLGHGSGGLLTGRLIRDLVLKYFPGEILKQLEDSAEIPARALRSKTAKIAFTTDAYVIDPIFFPGGDIGKLAVCGTVNDLAMKGARPRFLSVSVIIEEGFDYASLKRIFRSAAQTARRSGIEIVCGDTKVVDKGKADKIFIVTSGLGTIMKNLDRDNIKPGDRVLVSGTLGDHGTAVMNARLRLGLRTGLKSDVAPLNLITDHLFKGAFKIHFMRDPTRGGLVTLLNEAIQGTSLGIVIDEAKLPIRKEVRGISEILGLDPLYIANEGKFVAIVDARDAERTLKAIKEHPLGRKAVLVGEVVDHTRGVWLATCIGGQRPLLQLEAEGLPRIC